MNSITELQQLIEGKIGELNLGVYPPELYDPAHYVLNMGGKRMRPLLMVLTTEMCNGNIAHALEPAIGFELFHNFTLMHDDIMDKAPLRRGKPTVHEKWNMPTAILAGDALFVKSVQFVRKCENNQDKIMDVFLRNALLVCEGQQLDMDFESGMDVSIHDYLDMISRKTAALPGACMQAGALAAGADDETALLLYETGKNIGIAFQLKDDLLDAYGDSHKFGKQQGGDILANKKTFLFLKSIELLSAPDADQLKSIIRLPSAGIAKVQQVIKLFDKAGVKHETELLMQEYYSKALDCLRQTGIDPGQTKFIEKLFAQLMQRET